MEKKWPIVKNIHHVTLRIFENYEDKANLSVYFLDIPCLFPAALDECEGRIGDFDQRTDRSCPF